MSTKDQSRPDILSRLHHAGKCQAFAQPDPDIVFEFTPHSIAAERVAR